MGDNSLPKIAAPPVEVPASSDQYNAVVDTLQGDLVARNAAGGVEDGAGDIGKPESGRFDKLHLKTGMTVNSKAIDFSALELEATGVLSGESKASGFPDFLQAGGAGHDYFKILAASTHLEMTIEGALLRLEVDRQSDPLALAPGSNNTCLVNDANIAADPVWSKTIGEFGYWITIDTVGSEITSLDGTTQCFKIYNGADTEVMIADVDTANNRLIPILRGIGGTDRIAFSNNDTITLLKGHYIFLDNDLATISTTTNYPKRQYAAPSSPATGYYWLKTSDQKWYRWSGTTWEALGRIYLGYAICDNADCLWVEHVDYNLAWDSFLTLSHCFSVGKKISFPREGVISVAGCKINISEKFADINNIDYHAPGLSVVSSAWYYLYITPQGQLLFDDVSPRPENKKLGKYHPLEYWRLIGMAYRLASGDFAPSIIRYSHRVINYDLTGGNGLPSLTTISGDFVEAHTPPIVSRVNYRLTGVEAGGALVRTVTAKPLYSELSGVENVLFFCEVDNAGGTTKLSTFADYNFISSGIIECVNHGTVNFAIATIYFGF